MIFNKSRKGIRRGIPVFILAAVFLAAVCFTIFGAEISRYGMVNTEVDNVNIRSGAGTSYSRVGSVPPQAQIEILGEENGSDGYVWYIIEYNGTVGYIRSDFVNIIPEKTTENDTIVPDTTAGDETTARDTTGSETTGGNEPPEVPPQIDFEQYLEQQCFPESYKTYLRQLHAIYPNWIFKAQHIDFDFSYAVEKEKSLSLVGVNSISSWKSVEGDAYNWETNTWYGFDGPNWVRASEAIIAYYMDPRNFLGVNSVFQFLEQSFDGNIQSIEGVKQIIAGTFMETDVVDTDGNLLNYATAIYDSGKQYQVNPYVLAAMIVQEQGTKGTSGLISGTYPGYEGYFNYFNIGAYSSGNMDAVQRGLWYAKGGNNGATTNLRPWNTRLKAINGGAYFYAKDYTNAGQTTLYLKRFNVQGDNPFTHQYMTGIQGAAGEATELSQGYSQELRSASLSFLIPVYNNMPEQPVEKPTGDGSPNMKLSLLSVTGYELTPEFNADVLEYMLVVPANVNSITVNAAPMESTAIIEGVGELILHGDSNVFEIKVTAGNGAVRVYKLSVARQSSVDFGRVTLTEYYKTRDNVVYGISPGTVVADFKAQFVSEGKLIVKNSQGVEKGDMEAVVTGDVLAVSTTTNMPYGEYTASVRGDIDCDGNVSIGDLLKVRNKMLGTGELNLLQLLSGDIDGDGGISIGDLLKIRNHMLGTSLL